MRLAIIDQRRRRWVLKVLLINGLFDGGFVGRILSVLCFECSGEGRTSVGIRGLSSHDSRQNRSIPS